MGKAQAPSLPYAPVGLTILSRRGIPGTAVPGWIRFKSRVLKGRNNPEPGTAVPGWISSKSRVPKGRNNPEPGTSVPGGLGPRAESPKGRNNPEPGTAVPGGLGPRAESPKGRNKPPAQSATISRETDSSAGSSAPLISTELGAYPEVLLRGAVDGPAVSLAGTAPSRVRRLSDSHLRGLHSTAAPSRESWLSQPGR